MFNLDNYYNKTKILQLIYFLNTIYFKVGNAGFSLAGKKRWR